MAATVTQIYRYPVKGLSPELLGSVQLQTADGIPQDRRFAVAHGESQFDPANPGWVPRRNFVVVANAPQLTAVTTRYDDATGLLHVSHDGREIRGDLATAGGRSEVVGFLAAYLGEQMPQPFSLVEAPGAMLTDAQDKFVSIISHATCRDLGQRIGTPVDHRRFRGNLLMDGIEPWSEFEWLGRTLRVGEVTLEVVERIGRCAATNADPDKGERDMNIPLTLQRAFGHFDCGVYARVASDGRIAAGDEIGPA